MEIQVAAIHTDLIESVRIECNVADNKHASLEASLERHRALTKAKLNDMLGCILDHVEHRLRELHATVHEQTEEVHLRVDAQQLELATFAEKLESIESRLSQLGAVTSSCLATARSLCERVNKLEGIRMSPGPFHRKATRSCAFFSRKAPRLCLKDVTRPQKQTGAAHRERRGTA